MKRLTEQYNGEWVTEHAEEMDYFLIKGKAIDRLAAYEDSGLSPDEVQELAKAEAEGRLAILPLKVGSTIYRPEAPQYSWEIVSATIYLDETIFTDDSDNIIKETDIGKTVFLTREEAEKAKGSETERGKRDE